MEARKAPPLPRRAPRGEDARDATRSGGSTACYRGQSFVSPGWQDMLEQVPELGSFV